MKRVVQRHTLFLPQSWPLILIRFEVLQMMLGMQSLEVSLELDQAEAVIIQHLQGVLVVHG
jgi:hypothetical protein